MFIFVSQVTDYFKAYSKGNWMEKKLWKKILQFCYEVWYKNTHFFLPRIFYYLGYLDSDSHNWLIATDEACFYLTESINKKNNRLWLTERPQDWIENPLQDSKVLVWCAISCRKVYGPYFFDATANQLYYL